MTIKKRLARSNIAMFVIPVLVAAAIASTPLAATLWRKLPQRAAQALGTLAILAGLALCTAYLVAGTYNPFLYFRF